MSDNKQAERVYRVKQAEEIPKFKEEKHPVTLIMELVKGNKEVGVCYRWWGFSCEGLLI